MESGCVCRMSTQVGGTTEEADIGTNSAHTETGRLKVSRSCRRHTCMAPKEDDLLGCKEEEEEKEGRGD